MRIVFHIGMGKTGTSSIQKALGGSAAELAAQKARYLGMWFEMVDQRFSGHEGLAAFAAVDAAGQAANAAAFVDKLKAIAAADGTDLFIHSNEGIFGNALRLAPFFEAVTTAADVRIIAYMRPPRDWLPSAFTQWNIRHKQQAGPIQPFGQRARTLIGQYDAVRLWRGRFGDKFEARLFDKDVDVVADFAAAIGISLPAQSKRFLERSEPAETLFRALYNNRFEAPMMPERFNGAVINTNRRTVPSVAAMADLCFAHDGIDEIVEERRELFDYVRETVGLDLLRKPSPASEMPDRGALTERVVDYLVEIVLDQAARLKRLERMVEERTEDGGPSQRRADRG